MYSDMSLTFGGHVVFKSWRCMILSVLCLQSLYGNFYVFCNKFCIKLHMQSLNEFNFSCFSCNLSVHHSYIHTLLTLSPPLASWLSAAQQRAWSLCWVRACTRQFSLFSLCSAESECRRQDAWRPRTGSEFTAYLGVLLSCKAYFEPGSRRLKIS